MQTCANTDDILKTVFGADPSVAAAEEFSRATDPVGAMPHSDTVRIHTKKQTRNDANKQPVLVKGTLGFL